MDDLTPREIGHQIGQMLGDNLTPDVNEHVAVLLEAAELFARKNEERGDMWRQFPMEDKIRELRERVTRLQAISDRQDERLPRADKNRLMVEEGIDIINYAVFMIRQIREAS